MNVVDFRAQLEEELTWRTDEIHFFQNQCAIIEIAENQDKFRRALILLLYSNFEGFCKFGFSLYVSAINEESIKCKDAHYVIVAASLNAIFKDLRDGKKKSSFFKNDDPDDSKLHLFAREHEFIQRASELMNEQVRIPENIVDMASNLKPIILKKNLYRLGLPHNQFVSLEPDIKRLINLRNSIAHGESKQGISEKEYEVLKVATFNVMNNIARGLTKAFDEKWFLKNTCPLIE